ncbi:MAG: hypothetical protein ACPGOY_14155 [Rhodospirillaceae bacterium]
MQHTAVSATDIVTDLIGVAHLAVPSDGQAPVVLPSIGASMTAYSNTFDPANTCVAASETAFTLYQNGSAGC